VAVVFIRAAPGRPEAALVILLDTNALIWLEQGHRRARPLEAGDRTLYVSPAALLELQFLVETGRIRLREGTIGALESDDRWLVDDPPAVSWFRRALDLGWTRDPFDRLIVAHARLRGWRVATGDRALLARLGPRERLEL
jgi:PIN domain nuclease of toxin-antitoxin system